MYRPRCWEAILFLATTSYLFSKTYPSPGEERRGKENAGLDVWFWLLFVPDTPTPEKNRGAQTGFENTLLRIREAIHSLVETVGQDTHEEREKCLNVWCLHELLEVRGYCIGRLHFLWMMKPKGAGRVSNIDRGLPFLPPPPAPGVRMRWPRRQLIMQPAQKGQIITARVCVYSVILRQSDWTEVWGETLHGHEPRGHCF